jgi:putative ABC transport system substrate-binding protein
MPCGVKLAQGAPDAAVRRDGFRRPETLGLRCERLALARRLRIPWMSYTTAHVEVGGLFVYAANLDDMSHRAATYVDKIVRGSSPADMPVELPAIFDFVVNAKTARDMGLSLPNSIVLRATRVID